MAENNAAPLSMEAFAEDWNESQFWVCLSLLQIFVSVADMPFWWANLKLHVVFGQYGHGTR